MARRGRKWSGCRGQDETADNLCVSSALTRSDRLTRSLDCVTRGGNSMSLFRRRLLTGNS